MWLGIVVAAAVAALLVAAYAIGYNRGKPGEQVAKLGKTQTNGSNKKNGSSGGNAKAMFSEKCGTCHTLKAAGTSGQVGPSLDSSRPDAARVEDKIKNGGSGMPDGLLKGKEAKEVAKYVAKVAGG